MLGINSVNLFLDESLADELWTLAKRDGLTVEKVGELEQKLKAGTKLGFGNLWKWLAADIEGDIEGELSHKSSSKMQFTSVFRAMVLPSLLGDITEFPGEYGILPALEIGGFIKVTTQGLELVQLPSYAQFISMMILSGRQDPGSEMSKEQLVETADKIPSLARALSFWMKTDDESDSIAKKLFDKQGEQLINAMMMSNDDHILAVAKMNISDDEDDDVFVVSVLEEKYLKRHQAAYAIGRPVEIFGRVTYWNDAVLGVQAVSINLI